MIAFGAVFVVAMLYASVGHGGASGYLAILTLLGMPPAQMATSALLLNVLVAGVALAAFARAGHFSWRLTWPLVAASVPAAWLGGWVTVSAHAYDGLLAVVLLVAAWRLWRAMPEVAPAGPIPLAVALPAGAGIGVLSGLVGVGGGIFVSPLLVLARWATLRSAAATSAAFIVANSLAGLGGRAARGALDVGPLRGLLVAAALGGIIGSSWGARRGSRMALRRVLAAVLVMAVLKVVVS